MEKKHTPAPWKVMYTTSKEGECALSVVSGGTEEGDLVSPICKVSPVISEDETDKANARLIAASPRLLAALKKVAIDYETISIPSSVTMDEVYSAIQEATGEEFTGNGK